MKLKTQNNGSTGIDTKILIELYSLAKFAILESFEASYYASSDEHANIALNRHKDVFEKYPEYYVELFTNESISSMFKDASKIISSLFLLSLEKTSKEAIFDTIKEVQINKIFHAFENALISSALIERKIEKVRIREIFYLFLEWLEQEKGQDYTVFFTVKYKAKLQSLFARLRINRKKISKLWNECIDILFLNKTEKKEFNFKIFKEILNLRETNNAQRLKKIKKLPFSVFIGYAFNILLKEYNQTEKDLDEATTEKIKKAIFRRTDLMSNNEVRRYLKILNKLELLEDKKQKKTVASRVKKGPAKLFSLLNSLFSVEGTSKDIMVDTIEERIDKFIERMEAKLNDTKLGIAVDVSANMSGYTYTNDDIEITMRRIFPRNLVIGYTLLKASKNNELLLFNDTYSVINLKDLQTRELVENLIGFVPDGGTAPLYALEILLEQDHDIIVIISDFNDNVPMKGVFRLKLPELAEKFQKPILLLQTDFDITELTALEDVILKERLDNVYLLSINNLSNVDQIFEILEFEQKLKEKIRELILSLKKKK